MILDFMQFKICQRDEYSRLLARRQGFGSDAESSSGVGTGSDLISFRDARDLYIPGARQPGGQ